VARNIILVGNKTDLEDRRKVSYEEAVKLGKKLNLAAVMETSAKNDSWIDDVFYRSVINCADMYKDGVESLSGSRQSWSARPRKYSA
jgi:GTPase SAR1 family protein